MKAKKLIAVIAGCLVIGGILGYAGFNKLAKDATFIDSQYPTTNENSTGEVLNSLVDPVDRDYDEIVNELYRICFNQPETLASTLTGFPNALKAAGCDKTDPLELEDIFNHEGSVYDQNQLLWLLRDILERPTTKYSIISYSGKAKIMGMVKIDESLPSSPQNITLAWFVDIFDQARILQVEVLCADGSYDTAYLHLGSGFGRLEPLSD